MPSPLQVSEQHWEPSEQDEPGGKQELGSGGHDALCASQSTASATNKALISSRFSALSNI